MMNLQRRVGAWANQCRSGQLPRRQFLQRVLLAGGSIPVAVTLLNRWGFP